MDEHAGTAQGDLIMVSDEMAIKQLDDRIELWEDYGGKHGDDAAAREWLDVLRMSRDALAREKKNRELKEKIILDLEQLPSKSRFSLELVREIVEGFEFGEKMA